MDSGKRFLICHSILQNIMGSTLVALELAEYLHAQGYRVVVYASFIGDPMLSVFRDKGIEVVDDAGADNWRFEDFDYIWIHSQVLPLSLSRQLGEHSPDRMPLFIFHHMSALAEAADEFPYMALFEESLSSLSLFVSEEARDTQSGFFAAPVKTALFRNPVPPQYGEAHYCPTEVLRRVLWVSNHDCAELHAAMPMLREHGVEVVTLGQGKAQQMPIAPDLLAQFDLVISIGKTVPMCLVMGVPVYVYDHFGGFGYLGAENYAQAAYANFSGRGGARYSAEEIVRDVIGNYASAVQYQRDNHVRFRQEFALDRVLPAVLQDIERKEVRALPSHMCAAWHSAQLFANRFYKYWGWLSDIQRASCHTQAELSAAREENARLQDRGEQESIAHAQRLEQELKTQDSLRAQVHHWQAKAQEAEELWRAIRGSKAFRLGNALTAPVRWVRCRRGQK